MKVLGWVLGGSKGTGTAGLGLPWLPPSAPTWGLEATQLPGLGQAHGIRLLRFLPALAERGIEVRPIPWPAGTTLDERHELALEAIAWADVAVWWGKGYDWVCSDCPFVASWDAEAYQHWQAGERVFPSDLHLRDLWAKARARNLPLVIDADDWFTATPAFWAGKFRDRFGDPYREAALLTVSTPAMERVAQRFNPNVRVIRNAITAAFVPNRPRPDGPTRLVWYGVLGRERDFTGSPLRPGERASYCRQGVQDHRAKLRTICLGWNTHYPDAEAQLRAAGFDELHPVVDWRVWEQTLANAYPEIGVAPLRVNAYNACKSELHWLEFAAAGAPCVCERWRGGPGPYDVVRDGVDGFLARGRAEWSDAIGKLIDSPALRAEIAGRARERIIAEYDPRQRVEQMISAWTWAAEHPRAA
ncbi:MAG: glycosyltransferase [Candidatus Limnocylindrales bacterium]|jgi:hypothetical protein